MKTLQGLSDSEREVMEAIWEMHGPVTAAQLLERFAHKEWKKQTMSTFLARLVEKGALRLEKQGKPNYYVPALTPAEYRRREARQVIDELYQGSLPDFLTAFYGEAGIGRDEAEQLRSWFERECGHD